MLLIKKPVWTNHIADKMINALLIQEMDCIAENIIDEIKSENLKKFSEILDTKENKKIFGEYLYEYFEGYMPKEMSYSEYAETYVALYSMLKSDKSWIPTIEMESILVQVINHGIECYSVISTTDTSIIPLELVKDVSAVLYKRFEESGDVFHITENVKVFVDELAETLKAFVSFNDRLYDLCITDLNNDTTSDPLYDDYILPENWYKSDKFYFLCKLNRA